MVGFILKRLLWTVFLLVAMTLFTFILFFVVSAETTRVGRGANANDINLREAYQLEQASLPFEYAEFVWTVVRHGSLGTSFRDGRPVTDILAAALPVTVSLVAGGVLLFLLIAVPIGVLSALRPRSLLDRLAMIFVLVGVSAHPAWIGLVLSYFLGVRWGLTPIAGYCDLVDPAPVLKCGGLAQWSYHLVLPWITFAFLFAALYARMIRASILETLGEDYVRTARAKGAPTRRVLGAHVLRNAMLPVVTMLGMDIALAFGGAVFIEQVYGLPGIGKLTITALPRRDLPVIMGVVIVVATAVALFNLVIDLVYGFLDPRVRRASSRADIEEGEELRLRPAPAPVAATPGP